MAKSAQIKKEVFGPLTANAQAEDGSPIAPGVAFRFPDDTSIMVNLQDMPQDVITRLAVHGLSQKLGDSYAGAAEAENPLAYAKESVQEVLKQLLAGDWRVTGTGGPRATMLAKALARVTGKDLEECVMVVENMEDEQKKALRKDPRIKKASSEIRLEEAARAAERAKGLAEQVDGEADLGSLFEG